MTDEYYNRGTDWSQLDLEEIGRRSNTDKYRQGYLPHYEKHLKKHRQDAINIVELGVRSGQSLLMWQRYFPQATVWGVDIDPACMEFHDPEHRVHVLIADQRDAHTLLHNLPTTAQLVLDDASHLTQWSMKSFDILWPSVDWGGLYVVEDIHCAAQKRPMDRITPAAGSVLDVDEDERCNDVSDLYSWMGQLGSMVWCGQAARLEVFSMHMTITKPTR